MSHTWLELDLAPSIAELEEVEPALSSAVDRFARDLEAENARKPGRRSIAVAHHQLPKLPGRRPISAQVRLPVRLQAQIPPSILQLRGSKTANKRIFARRSARPFSGQGAELQIAVQHVADAIRMRLLDLHKGLQKFQHEFAGFAAVVQLGSLSISKRRTL